MMFHDQLLHLIGLAMEKATPKFQNMSLCGTDPFHVRLRRKPLTETPRHGEKFLLGTPTSSSASSPLRDDPTENPRNPIPQTTVPILALAGFKPLAPDQDTGMDLNEPWISALGLFNAGE